MNEWEVVENAKLEWTEYESTLAPPRLSVVQDDKAAQFCEDHHVARVGQWVIIVSAQISSFDLILVECKAQRDGESDIYFNGSLGCAHDPEIMWQEAVRWVLLQAVQLGWKNIRCSLDFKTLVTKLNKKKAVTADSGCKGYE
ncbi:high affinity immunoglobulin gamma Fc receptor I [Striga asiatica]|uniref:High affinity immunoglobulin gamma Fc receptor I n=1 Tax=Striga asiatica TaxID=4170 RepID=A0A5A7RBH2_STRAF|nr:high affinity immunoglobulin gamma Fc receptor I [Striga asiatica]